MCCRLRFEKASLVRSDCLLFGREEGRAAAADTIRTVLPPPDVAGLFQDRKPLAGYDRGQFDPAVLAGLRDPAFHLAICLQSLQIGEFEAAESRICPGINAVECMRCGGACSQDRGPCASK